jgi:hypothetical protein
MKKTLLVSALALALAVPASAQADKWGGPLRGIGAWGKKLFKKGVLGEWVQKAMKKHPALGKLAQDALKALNDTFGKMKGCFPNIRLALGNLVNSAAKGAKTALAPPLKSVMEAFQQGVSKIGEGGKSGIVKAIQAALKDPGLKKAAGHVKKSLRTAMSWVKKPCKLWKPAKKPAAAAEKGGEKPAEKPAETPAQK